LNIPATQDPFPTPDKYITEGDAHFSKMHLYGWRQAEASYECAFEIQEQPATLAKLMLTRFLLLIRETEEGIFRNTYLEDLNFICQNANGPFQLTLCETARNRLTLEGVLDEAPLLDLSPAVSRKLLDERKRDSALDGYLFLLFLQDMAPYRIFDESELFKQEYPDSPLADYLHSVQDKAGSPLKVVADAEFAELEMHVGERLIERERYQEGITSLSRALKLIPDYTSASIAIGNLFLFTLEYPKAALPHYESALKWDPENVQARFGQAVSRHYLGDYLESQSSLDRLLDKNRSRWRTVDRESHPYYRGQACYFKAYNYYLTGQKVEARKWVEKARPLQPEADGPYYLSGVLHFEDESLAEAEQDFLKVIVKGTSLCDSYFRLGRIEHWKQSKSALFHFIDNGICLERNLAVVRTRLEKARQMQLDPAVREQVEELFEQDLKKRQNDAIASVVSMINLAQSMEFIDTTQFQETMEERLSRISRVSENH
jgi:tetratricopeptide (TPR) repeat protein